MRPTVKVRPDWIWNKEIRIWPKCWTIYCWTGNKLWKLLMNPVLTREFSCRWLLTNFEHVNFPLKPSELKRIWIVKRVGLSISVPAAFVLNPSHKYETVMHDERIARLIRSQWNYSNKYKDWKSIHSQLRSSREVPSGDVLLLLFIWIICH